MNPILVAALAGYSTLLALYVLRRKAAARLGGLLVVYLLVSLASPVTLELGPQLKLDLAAVQQVTAVVLTLQTATLGLLTFFALGWRGRVWWLAAGVLWIVAVGVVRVAWPQQPPLVIGGVSAGVMLAVAVGGWVLLSAALAVLVVYAYLTARLPLHANRVLFWGLMLGVTIAGQAVVLSPSLPTAEIGLLLQFTGAVGLTYSVVYYRLFDVRDALRRGAGYVLSALVIASVVLVGLLVANQFASVGGASGAAGVVLIALGLAFLFQPLWNLSQRLIVHYVLGERAEPAKFVRDYSQAISEILDVEQLATAAIGIISDVFEVRRGALLLVTPLDDGRFRLRPVRGMGQLPQDERELTAASLVLRRLIETRGPLLQYDVDLGPDYRELDAAERLWWHNLAMDVYVPVMGRELPIGILALGPKGTGESFRQSELDLLTTLAGQTAAALKNARLFGDMRQLNSEVQMLNDNLQRTNERLKNLDQVKTDFITIASHELRTPLTQVRGYTDILSAMNEEGQLSGKQVTEIAGSLSRAAERLDQVISAMLDVSQLDVQAMSLHFVETTVDTVLRFSIEKLAAAMRERKQTLTVKGTTNLPAIQGDFQRLSQAFNNLLTNAIKFTPDGGQITITGQILPVAVPGNGAGEFVEVIVTDTGVGLEPKDQELIFEKFYRVGNPHFHSTGTTKFMGAGPGLGLAIARGVIEAHGGRLWVESPGFDPKACPGSSFHVVLPLRPPAQRAEQDVPDLKAVVRG